MFPIWVYKPGHKVARPWSTNHMNVPIRGTYDQEFSRLGRDGRAGDGPGAAGVPFERDVAALGLVASGQMGTNVQIDFGYRGQLGKALKDHGVRGGVTVQF
jgi:uncharacterized protein with beta-barrel porin domain